MKKVLASCILLLIFFSACGPKPMYKTRQGKRKREHYNMHQYDRYERDLTLINEMEHPKKKKDKKKKYKFQ